jgi:hypothetical protein
MVLMSHMMVLMIILLGILNFYLSFKFKIYKKNHIVPISHMMILISYLMEPIE